MMIFPLYSVYTPHLHLFAADIPLKKAVAGVRVGLLPELGFVVNPTVQQMEESKLDLIMAGTDSAVLMIEGYCDFLTEDQMLEVSFPCCPRDVSFAVPGTASAVHGTSFAVPGTSPASQGHLLLSQGYLLFLRDTSCFPGMHFLQNSQCTYMLVG